MTKKIRSVSNTCIIMLVCIGINYMGKVLAADWHLPLWMDSIGTGMSACLLGPFFGALCGATNNILYGMRNVTSYAYAFTSVAIAIVMGICMRRHMILTGLVSLRPVHLFRPLQSLSLHHLT